MISQIPKNFRHTAFVNFTSLFGSCSCGVRQNVSDRLFSTGVSETIFKESTSLAVKSLLQRYGFTEDHISLASTRCPRVFLLDAQKNVLPKLKFFTSIGLSKTDLPKFVLNSYCLMYRSLQNQIIPTCNFLLNNFSLNNEELARALKLNPGIVSARVDTVLAPNIALLREIGLSQREIALKMVLKPQGLCRSHEGFKCCLEKVISMGLKPSTSKFAIALGVMCSISEVTLEEKMMLYRSYGMSDDDVLLAFQKQPTIMSLSKINIAKTMDFLVGDLKWTPRDIACAPDVLGLNLDRVARRSRVMEMLVEKGKCKVRRSRSSFLKLGEEYFLDRYIHMYSDDLPELLDIYYNGKNKNGTETKRVLG